MQECAKDDARDFCDAAACAEQAVDLLNYTTIFPGGRILRPMTAARTVMRLAATVLAASTTVAAQRGAPTGEWPTYTGDLGHTRYAPLDQITAANFVDLEVAWRFKTDNLGPRPEFNLQSTPLVFKGRLYSTGGTRRAVVSLDAGTGELKWVYSLDEGARGRNAPRQLSGRGLAYWTDGNEERILYVTPGYRLVALDAATGRPVPSFGQQGIVDLKQNFDQALDLEKAAVGLHATPIVAGNIVIVGAAFETGANPRSKINAKGYVRGFDARTGRRLWIFRTIPGPGEFGNNTWGRDSWGLHRQHRRVGADLGGPRTGPGVPARGTADARLLPHV